MSESERGLIERLRAYVTDDLSSLSDDDMRGILALAERGIAEPDPETVRASWRAYAINIATEARKAERADVVAWLREREREGGGLPIMRSLFGMANAIEGGAHEGAAKERAK